MKKFGYRNIHLMAADGRNPLLIIDLERGTVEGPLENASAAADAFVKYLRGSLAPAPGEAGPLKLRPADADIAGEWAKGWNACLDAANNELALRRARAEANSFPEGTPGKSGSEDSPHDAAATAAGRGAVRDDNPSGGGTPGEWLERQPTSRPCTCGHPREHHSTFTTTDEVEIGGDCAVCSRCAQYDPDPHECSPQRCCHHCKRHTNPHKGCILR